ncbi:MAG: type II toxin-antitoxin system VapC family toxin [Chthoniobacteraceae bacterium]
MPHSIFIETTIPSYYVARPSRNLLQFARQELTREWWDGQRQQFDLFTSQLVLDEAAEGEQAKASERLQLLDGIALLELDKNAESLATKLIESGILPSFAGRDASHLAVAGVHGMDFLLTWNCKHIANPFLADRLQSCFSGMGVHLPVICTPEQFFTDDTNDTRDQTPEGD